MSHAINNLLLHVEVLLVKNGEEGETLSLMQSSVRELCCTIYLLTCLTNKKIDRTGSDLANGPTILSYYCYQEHGINHALDLIKNNYKHNTNGVRMCVTRRCEFKVSEKMCSITLVQFLLAGD